MTIAMVTGQDAAIRSTTTVPMANVLPVAPTAGNTLLGSFTSNGGTAGTAPAGWTLLASSTWSGGGPMFAGIYMHVVGAGESATNTYTPVAGTSNEWHVTEFSGLSAPALDSSGATDTGIATVTTSSSGTTGPLAGTGDLVYAAMFASGGTASPTLTNGFTLLAKPTGGRSLCAWKQAADQTAQTTQFSWTSPCKAAAVIVAVSPIALAGGGTGFTGWGIPI